MNRGAKLLTLSLGILRQSDVPKKERVILACEVALNLAYWPTAAASSAGPQSGENRKMVIISEYE